VKADDQVIGDLLIRNCNIGDLTDVERIEKASFDDPYSAIIFWSLFLDPKVFFRVAVTDENLVGYSIVKFEKVKDSKKAHLVSIATEPKVRRRGFGHKLLQDAINIARRDAKVGEIILEVNEDNETAISLYKKFGFIQKSMISSYYSDGKDALVFSLSLL
jgi:[ribosomal protein S18]-alanine N-acetyltransferase